MFSLIFYNVGNDEERDDGEEDFDWQVEQQPFCGDEEDGERLGGNVTYGFANRRSGVFKRLRVWFTEQRPFHTLCKVQSHIAMSN